MLSVYLLPIVLRPIDFLMNMPQYVVGLFSYIFMLPIFINVMQVYSMANLHDISWGNRPSATAGTEVLSANAKKQERLKSNYMVFRVNFVTFWIGMNILYVIVVSNYVDNSSSLIANDGSFGFLEIFASYLACLVLYRVFFGGIHILKFKLLSNCVRKYKTFNVDLHQEYKNLRKNSDWNDSVAESDFQLLQSAGEFQDEQTILDETSGKMVPRPKNSRIRGQISKMDQTCIDTDDDDLEFEDARKEEERDMYMHQTSAFMVKQENISKYINETVVKNEGKEPTK